MTISDWLNEIKEARQREKDFRKDGEEIEEIYEGEKPSPYNILYSNTEILLPALFSRIPRPNVSRRFKDDDPLGKVVSEASNRMLEYLIDTDLDEYESFKDSIESAVMDALLPGRGITTIKYDAELDKDEDDNDYVKYETVCTDTRKWNSVVFGYAKKWSKVPWIAYEEYLSREDFKDMDLPTEGVVFTEGEEKEEEHEKEEHQGNRKTALIYQVWVKKTRKIIYICPQVKDKPLKEIDDPLGLTGFFNCPKPLQLIRKSNNLEPTPLYNLYKKQAEELNRVQTRISRVVEAIKVRGAYDGNLGEEIENILKNDDNALIPTDKASSLIEGGFDKAIWMLPIGELVGVLQQLYVARESCKKVIFEITGISDILRGSSLASETLGAQKIKEAWGSMRIKSYQNSVKYYVCEVMQFMLDIAARKFSEETWQKITGLQYPTQENKQRALELLKEQQMRGQVDPQLQKLSQMPTWEDILGVLKNNFTRSYKIDIETNSTLEVEATEDKQLISEFMNAIAQFLNGIGPLIQEGIMPFGAAKAMLLAITRRFQFGRLVEDEINAMQPPQGGNPQELKKKEDELTKLQKSVEDQHNKYMQEVQKEAQKLQQDKMEFEFTKKLSEQKLKQDEQFARDKIVIMEEKAMGQIEKLLARHERSVQSLLDKQNAKLAG